jgi:hypothetical protein
MKSLFVPWRRILPPLFFAFLVALPNAGHAQSNTALSVIITQPTNGSVFTAPVNIPIDASVYDPAGEAAYVLFRATYKASNNNAILTVSLGSVSNFVSLNPTNKLYSLVWSNVPALPWSIAATAVRSNGTVAGSPMVQITVNSGSRPSLSVEIASPTNGATYPGPANIELIAGVVTTNDAAAFVEFFDGSRPLGVVSNWAVVDPPGSPGLPPGSHAYLFDWTNQSVGNHVLTAIATATNGSTFSSPPVTITVGSRTNSPPPVVLITQPTNGLVFRAPVNIPIDVSVYDPAAEVAYVSFRATSQASNNFAILTTFLGSVSNFVSLDPPYKVYSLVWSNVPALPWSITAEAVRSNGIVAASAMVRITVGNPTNVPPIVRITSPPNNSEFRAPVNVALLAYSDAPIGSVTSVEFFAGSNSLGFGKRLWTPFAEPLLPGGPRTPTPSNSPVLFLTKTFELIWSNAPPGSYALTALAADNDGGAATSAPVNITILPAPAPPTNRPAIVSIVATDPIAIEGTNCWRWLDGPPTWSNWISPAAIWRWYTNCGPKDATFTLSRNGSTNDDLTVNYSIGGTAANGVDYATLPGDVTIPAGQTEAMIIVVPIQAAATVISKTVILALKPATNVPPDYLLGIPRGAEAIIIDSEGPQPLGAFLPDGSFHLSLTGPDGAWFHIDYTTDLINWTPVCTNQVINGSIDFIDPDAATSPTREYRAVPIANPPSDFDP